MTLLRFFLHENQNVLLNFPMENNTFLLDHFNLASSCLSSRLHQDGSPVMRAYPQQTDSQLYVPCNMDTAYMYHWYESLASKFDHFIQPLSTTLLSEFPTSLVQPITSSNFAPFLRECYIAMSVLLTQLEIQLGFNSLALVYIDWQQFLKISSWILSQILLEMTNCDLPYAKHVLLRWSICNVSLEDSGALVP